MLPLRIRKSFPGVKSAQKFSGMQLTDEVHWRYVYDRDGTLRSYSMGTKKVGKWAVEKDELCLYLEEPDDGCYEVSLSDGRISELVRYFLRLGFLGFGGPVALVGQMEREFVDDRKWLTKEQMREAIAICQSLPGPLAIQVGIYISYLRGGFWGAWAGGWAFILPNFVIVAALGALYVFLGDLRPVTAIFYGVGPAGVPVVPPPPLRPAPPG